MANVCFAPGCKSGYRKTLKENKAAGKKNPILFSAPQDLETLQKWQRAIPRKDKVFAKPSKLCELHFDEECIIRKKELKLSDGTSFIYEYERPSLKPKSVPTIFPNLPERFSSSKKKRRAPTDRSSDILVSLPQACSIPENDEVQSLSLIDVSQLKETNGGWMFSGSSDKLVCMKLDDACHCERHVVINKDCTVKAFLRNKDVSVDHGKIVKNTDDLSLLLVKIDKLIICETLQSQQLSKTCQGSVPESVSGHLCSTCLKSETKSVERKKKLTKQKTKLALKSKYVLRKNARLVRKVSTLKHELRSAWIHCKNLKDDLLQSCIEDLPLEQQTAIKTCVAAAKVKNKRSLRYSVQWIYECLLLRIKSKKAYEHLRNHKILALPTSKTLMKYIQEIKGTYGFHQSTFTCLQTKASVMNISERRGVILIDEMKLSKAANFNKKEMRISGFVDLGKYTPADQKDKLGDHALVFMFQPFKGKWVQALGCFLSKGAASGTILHHLAIECIALLEKSGFFVDVVVSDGASWNRNMWHHFGISEECVSCPHICDENRKLWFISDFPHLIKNVRNAITRNKEMMSHKGIISTKFWEAVLDMDRPKAFSLKACPKLTWETIHPQNFQTMNVPMAFQFFSSSVASAMTMYKDLHLQLEKSESCVEFINIFNAGIRAMNSRTPLDSLKPNSSSENAIKDMLQYVIAWEKFAKEKNFTFLPPSTSFGLKVTLKATLELLSFLINDCGFSFLMTSRLNQDSLERFFGMMRNAGGSNDHPDSHIFMQLYRLLSTYSLVKPPKGCCTESTEIFNALLTINDVKEEEAVKKKKWSTLLDSIIEQGTEELMPKALEMVDEHNYDMFTSSDFVISYVCGYVSRKCFSFTNCEQCIMAITDSNASDVESNKFIDLKSRGHLIYPSDTIVNLITALEETILKTISETKITSELLHHIMENIRNGQSLQLVGCAEHSHELSQKVVRFYLILRLNFICKQLNKNQKSLKTKKLRKLSKL